MTATATTDLASARDLLDLVNRMDRRWHAQPRDYEREALTRLFTLWTLPARLVSIQRPAELARDYTVLRNVRLTGTSVHEIFFQDQDFTEVDAIFFGSGSVLGHPNGGENYLVEVERKARERDRDYYRAMQRARKVSALFQRVFDVRLLPVLVYDDRKDRLTYPTFDEEFVVLSLGRLRELTGEIPITSPDEIPGRASDRTMVKLALLWMLARTNPDDPRATGLSVKTLIAQARREGLPLRLPVVGHQDLDRAPRTIQRWLDREREDDVHLANRRLSVYLDELEGAGAIVGARRHPVLTREGGDIVLNYSRFIDRGPNHA